MSTSEYLTNTGAVTIIDSWTSGPEAIPGLFLRKVDKKVHIQPARLENTAFRQNNTISTEKSTKISLFVRFRRFPYKKRYSSRLQRFMCFQPFSHGFTPSWKNVFRKCIKQCIHAVTSRFSKIDSQYGTYFVKIFKPFGIICPKTEFFGAM